MPSKLDESALRAVLAEARRKKFLGPAPLEAHLANGRAFTGVLSDAHAGRIVDLGSGGGVPALICAVDLPETAWVLVERGTRRGQWLEDAVRTLRLTSRVSIIRSSAAEVARDPDYEGWADAVTARSFGPPPVTAECACRFLRLGGLLVVSEPPEPGRTSDALDSDAQQSTRWDHQGLRPTGLAPVHQVSHDGTTLQILARRTEIDPRLPRRDAAMKKRPLF